MSRVRFGARATVVSAALVVLLAACGASPATSTSPDTASPDLFQALAAPRGAPVQPTPAAVSPIAWTRTTTKTTTTPPPRPLPPRPVPVAHPGPPAPVSEQWKPVGGDEFNAASLDTGKWGTYDSIGGLGHGYRRPEAISESGGSLHITAKGDVSGGMGASFGQLYGRWEFRARTDPGRGFGSAILLWPNSEKTADGELDMMEVPFETRDRANFVVHSGANGATQIGTALPGDFTQWHTFAMDWLPDRITWYVDGKKQYELTDKARIPTTPMHLAIQLDEGPAKDWILAPDQTTPPQINLDVDWVHVYAPASPPAPGGTGPAH